MLRFSDTVVVTNGRAVLTDDDTDGLCRVQRAAAANRNDAVNAMLADISRAFVADIARRICPMALFIDWKFSVLSIS